jgi:hypothetical protein
MLSEIVNALELLAEMFFITFLLLLPVGICICLFVEFISHLCRR